MTVDLDEAVRSVVADIVASGPEPGPTPTGNPTRPMHSHRQMWVSVAAAVIAIVGVGAIAVTRMSDDPTIPPAAADSILPAPTELAVQTPSTLTDPPVVTNSDEQPVAGAESLGLIEFQDWVGRYTLDFEDGKVVLGTTGAVAYTLESTPTLGCLVESIAHEEIARTCAGHDGIMTPLGTSPLVGSNRTRPDLWYAVEVVPNDIDHVELLHNGEPACQMERFPLEEVGNANMWACESTGPKPSPVELSVTRGNETVTTDGKLEPCAPGDECLYVVQTGDYPYLVAEKLCTTITALVAANGWTSMNDLPYPGAEIVAPTVPDRSACPHPAN